MRRHEAQVITRGSSLWRFTLVAICMAACLGVSSCGEAVTRHEGRSVTTARAVVNASLSAPGTPGSIVERLWHYLQLELPPEALYSYDPVVVKAVTPSILMGALASEESVVTGKAIVIVSEEQTPLGRLVNVETSAEQVAPTHYSFVLRRVGGQWMLVYDNLVDSGISEFAASQAQSTHPNYSAIQAAYVGQAAIRRFRLTSLPGGVTLGSSSSHGLH